MTSNSGALPPPHEPAQLLNALLSQQSPIPLPYSDDAKLLIHQHLLNLTRTFPGLRVAYDTFVHNDGNSVSALQAVGTFLMPFKGVKYNIPVTIWLLEDYPKTPPRVYVTPARDMVIKRHHTHVDASGLVSVPYLEHWVLPLSNLSGLVWSLSFIFREDPPLYSYTARSASIQRTKIGHSGGSPAAYPSAAVSQSLPIPTTPYPPKLPSPQQSSSKENSSESFKRNAINALAERLRKDVLQVGRIQEAETEKLINIQAQLKLRKGQLERGIKDIRSEKEGLERQLQGLLANTEALESWLKTNVKPDLEFDIDDVFEPCDILSRQMLQCTSADLEIEDTLYALDTAVQEGLIPMDKYLKHVRNLATEQFYHRAKSAKIQAAQQQIQVASIGIGFATQLCFT